MKRFTIEIYTHKEARSKYYDWEVEEDLLAYQFIHCALPGNDHSYFGTYLRDEYTLTVI